MGNEHLHYDNYFEETEGFSNDLLNYDLAGDLMDEALNSNDSLGKSSFLMMQPPSIVWKSFGA